MPNVTIVIDTELRKRGKEAARRDRRSFSAWVATRIDEATRDLIPVKPAPKRNMRKGEPV